MNEGTAAGPAALQGLKVLPVFLCIHGWSRCQLSPSPHTIQAHPPGARLLPCAGTWHSAPSTGGEHHLPHMAPTHPSTRGQQGHMQTGCTPRPIPTSAPHLLCPTLSLLAPGAALHLLMVFCALPALQHAALAVSSSKPVPLIAAL